MASPQAPAGSNTAVSGADTRGSTRDQNPDLPVKPPSFKAATQDDFSSISSQHWPKHKQAGNDPAALQGTDTAMEAPAAGQQGVGYPGYPQCQQHGQQGGWMSMPTANSSAPGPLPSGHVSSWGAAVAGSHPAAAGAQQEHPQQHYPPGGGFQQQQMMPPPLQQQHQQQQQQQQSVPWLTHSQPPPQLQQLHHHQQQQQHPHRQQQPMPQSGWGQATTAHPWQAAPAAGVGSEAAAAPAALAAGVPAAAPAGAGLAAAGDSFESILRPVVPERRSLHGIPVTSPMVMVQLPSRTQGEERWEPLHVGRMDCFVQCHINMAFVQMHMTFTFPASQGAGVSAGKRKGKGACFADFLMPRAPDTTVTKIYTDKGTKPGRALVTQVVEVPSSHSGSGGHSSGSSAEEQRRMAEQEAFEMLHVSQALASMSPGDSVRVTVEYMQPLHYDADTNNYVLQLPTLVQENCMPQGMNVRDVVSVELTVNTGLPEQPFVSCNYHPDQDFIKQNRDGCVTYEINKAKAWPASELLFSYSVGSRANTRASMQVLPARQQAAAECCTYPDQDTYLLSIMPPGREEADVRFPRDVVFLLDRSSAKTADRQYMQSARTALVQCLDRMSLQDADRLTVVDFNSSHNAWWSSSLVPASRDNLERCRNWLSANTVAAGGGSIAANISSCLDTARVLLTATPGARNSSSNTRLPTIIIMVDGPVDGERAICEMVEGWRPLPGGALVPIIEAGVPTQQQLQHQQQQPRVFTFGVGECSQLFLKRLAAAGRGMCKIAVPPSIKPAMEELLQAAGLPVLTDIQLQLQGLPPGKQFPRPIPDLCVGQPLVVTGFVPPGGLGQVNLVGRATGSGEWRLPVQVQAAGRAGMRDAVNQVAAYQELEYWATEAWRLGATEAGKKTQQYQQVRDRIIELSQRHSIPVRDFTELWSIEVKGDAQQFYQDTPLDKRVQLTMNSRYYLVGGAAVVGTVVVAGAALGIAAVVADFGDLLLSAPGEGCGACCEAGCFEMFTGCIP